MQIDPNIPLSAVRQPVEMPQPFQMYGQMLNLRSLLRSGQAQDLEMQAQQEARDRDQQVRQIFAKTTDLKTALPQIMAVDPKTGLALEHQDQANQEQAYKTQAAKLDLAGKQLVRLDQLAGMAHDQASYEAAIHKGLNEQSITPDMLSQLPAVFDPERIQRFRTGLLDLKSQLEEQRKRAEEAQKAALRPFELRKAEADAQTAEQAAKGTTPITPYQREQIARGKMPNTPTELVIWKNDPSRTPAEKAQAEKSLADLIKQANASRPPGADHGATVMVPDGKGGYTATRVVPGQSVAAGAVTPAGMSSLNVPTAATRAMAESAPKVLGFVRDMRQLLDANEKQLGPLAGRWSEFKTGEIGLKNKGYAKLRAKALLLQTALMRMHVGSRGGSNMLDHFKSLVDVGMQDPENLRANLEAIEEYANEVAREGGKSETTNPQPPSKDPLNLFSK